MKKVFVAVIAILCIILVGCGGNNNQPSDTSGNTYEIIISDVIQVYVWRDNQIVPQLVNDKGEVIDARYDYTSSSDDITISYDGYVTINSIPEEDITVTITERNTGVQKTITLKFIADIQKVDAVSKENGEIVTELNGLSYNGKTTLNVITDQTNIDISSFCNIICNDKNGNEINVFDIEYDKNHILLTAIGLGEGTLKIQINNSKGEILYQTIIPFRINWEESTEGFEFKINEDGTYSVVGYSGNMSEIRIPSKYEDSLVTHIGERAFFDNTALTRVMISDSVTSIGSFAFDNCTSLTSVTIPNSVTSIESYAFDDCTSLTSVYYNSSVEDWCNITFGVSAANPVYYANKLYLKNPRGEYELLTELVVPNTVTKINSYAFDNYTSLTSVTIPNSVMSIGNNAFSNCDSLMSITIPDSVTRIGSYTFEGCANLMSVTIGNSVTSIGPYAFKNCYKLVEVINKSSLNIIKGSLDDHGGVADYSLEVHSGKSKLVNKDGYLFYTYNGVNYLVNYTGKNENFFFPANYNGENYVINKYAFYDNHNINRVTIPDSVTSIGEGVFYSCTSLTSVTIPNSVTSIGDYAFSNCTSLTSVTIPDSVTSIGEWVFYSCTSLTSLTIPNSVTSIGDDAFYNCTSLTSVIIPDGVTSIGHGVFSHCVSLTSVTIPDGITSIGDHAFSFCYSLTSLTIPDSVTSIGFCAFSCCESLTSVTIPNSVTSIGDDAFQACYSLTSVTIPDSVTSIGFYAFNLCDSLNSVIFKNPDKWIAELFMGDILEISPIEFSAIEIANASTAATYLTSAYASYKWTRK